MLVHLMRGIKLRLRFKKSFLNKWQLFSTQESVTERVFSIFN